MQYVAYGSNLHPVRLRQRVPSATLLGTTVISDRQLRFHKRSLDGSAKCNLYPSPGAVYAAVYRISDAEKPELDRVEGLGWGYTTETIEISGFGSCYTYLAMDTQIDNALRPYTWYKDLVLLGCEFLRFPHCYLDSIAQIDAIADPDKARDKKNMRIVAAARYANSGLPEPESFPDVARRKF